MNEQLPDVPVVASDVWKSVCVDLKHPGFHAAVLLAASSADGPVQTSVDRGLGGSVSGGVLLA